AIPIHQRSVDQANALALFRRKPIELEAGFRQIEDAARYVHADDLGELMIGQQAAQELALAASQIEDAGGTRRLHHIEDGVEPPIVKTDRPLDRRFLLVLPLGSRLFL